MFVTFYFLAAVGLVMNSLLMYMIATNLKKMSAAELMMMHLSVSNIMQLIFRTLTIVIPDQQAICYPMSFPCKIPILLLCTARKVSMLFTLILGLFRLMKVKIKPIFVLSNTHVHLVLAATWFILIVACFPYLVLIPDNRPYNHNITGNCACSILHSLTNMDQALKLYDWVCGVGAHCFVIAAMFFVSIKMVLILLKHHKTVFVDGTLKRSRTRQRDFTAIKAVVSLLVFYVTCASFSLGFRLYSDFHVFDIQRITADIYTLVSPVILGYPYFRRLPCMSWHCPTWNQEQVIAIS